MADNKRSFDLKAALSGEPVRYRDPFDLVFLKLSKWEGRTCIQFSRIGERTEHLSSDLNGRVLYCTDGGDTQLTMAPRRTKRTVWVNIYKYNNGSLASSAYRDKEAAESAHKMCSRNIYVAVAAPIEIEEVED